jgi:hypothetical protein
MIHACICTPILLSIDTKRGKKAFTLPWRELRWLIPWRKKIVQCKQCIFSHSHPAWMVAVCWVPEYSPHSVHGRHLACSWAGNSSLLWGRWHVWPKLCIRCSWTHLMTRNVAVPWKQILHTQDRALECMHQRSRFCTIIIWLCIAWWRRKRSATRPRATWSSIPKVPFKAARNAPPFATGFAPKYSALESWKRDPTWAVKGQASSYGFAGAGNLVAHFIRETFWPK